MTTQPGPDTPTPAARIAQLPEPWAEMRERHRLWWPLDHKGARSCAECKYDWPCDTTRALDALEAALTDLATAVEALEFYADPDRYWAYDDEAESEFGRDDGRRARAALAAIDKEAK